MRASIGEAVFIAGSSPACGAGPESMAWPRPLAKQHKPPGRAASGHAIRVVGVLVRTDLRAAGSLDEVAIVRPGATCCRKIKR